jgi:hypothetical protein
LALLGRGTHRDTGGCPVAARFRRYGIPGDHEGGPGALSTEFRDRRVRPVLTSRRRPRGVVGEFVCGRSKKRLSREATSSFSPTLRGRPDSRRASWRRRKRSPSPFFAALSNLRWRGGTTASC